MIPEYVKKYIVIDCYCKDKINLHCYCKQKKKKNKIKTLIVSNYIQNFKD